MSKVPASPSTYLTKLSSSGLNIDDAKKLGFKVLTPEQSKKLGHREVEAFQIPYYDMSGKPTGFYRIRYLAGTKKGFLKQTDAKDQRYDQPSGAGPQIYFPPNLKCKWKDLLAKKEAPLYITEGELKAAAATKAGFPTIGLGGVWNFCSRKHGVALLPIFKEMGLEGKTVFIVYDSDAVANPQVIAAENELCRQLTNLKVEPLVVRLPALGDNKKTGLDDFIVAEGAEAFAEVAERAIPYKLAGELMRLSEEVVYVENPSIVLRRRDNYKMSVTTFKNEVFADRSFIDISGEKPRKVKTAEEWVRWEGRAVVEKFVYEPGKPNLVNGRFLNLWPGLPYEPAKGDIQPWHSLLDYLFKGEPESRKWFEQWCAYPFQFPGTKLFTAAVIWGIKTGTGKTLVGHTLQQLYGLANSRLIRGREIQRGNNSFAENKQFILVEELTGDERRAIMDDLKSLITNEEITVNIKYVPEYAIRSCINFLFTSNNPDALSIDETDRRFFIHEVKGEPLPEEFYTQVYDPWYKSEKVAALLHHFMTMDLSDFDPRRKAPMTASKASMVENSRTKLASWVCALRDNPDYILKVGSSPLPYRLWRSDDLLRLYDPEGREKAGQRAMAVELQRANFYRAKDGTVCRTKDGQFRLWVVRNDKKFCNFTPAQFGEYYDQERADNDRAPKFVATTPAATKGRKK